jgi:hypothetical protein
VLVPFVHQESGRTSSGAGAALAQRDEGMLGGQAPLCSSSDVDNDQEVHCFQHIVVGAVADLGFLHRVCRNKIFM